MKTNYTFGAIGIATVFLAGLTGCTTYVERPEPQRVYVPAPPPPQPPVVYVQPAPPPPAVVVIQNNDDFVQPLTPYGEWVVVGGYGRCWRPARVEAGWRPYANGHWESTGDGWYWVSDEPWAWATYHYGRWQLAGSYGWVWVPQTEWAPAWVSWRSGGGYVGWAPMAPEPRPGVSINVTIAPASFCFVEERRMHEPVRPTTVIVNNTTIINRTTIINKTTVVNKVVVNQGPRVDEVERVSGRKIQQARIADLRHHDEEPVAEKHGNLRAGPDRRPQADRNQPDVKRPEPPADVRPPNGPNRDRVQEKPAPDSNVRPQRDNEKPVRNDRTPVATPVMTPPPAPVRDVPPADDRAARDRQLREQQNLSAQPPQRGAKPIDAPVPPVAPGANTRDELRRQQQQEQQKKQEDLRLQRQQEQLQKQQDQKQKQLEQQQKQEDLRLQRQQDQLQKQQEQKQKQQEQLQKQQDQKKQQQEQRQLRQQNNNPDRNARAVDAPRNRQAGETNAPENPGQPAPK